MFFSAKEFHEFANLDEASLPNDYWLPYIHNKFSYLFGNPKPTRKQADAVLAKVKEGILNRSVEVHIRGQAGTQYINTFKFVRPWSVVEKLRNFRPPAGDYGVGVEVEYGFQSHEDAVSTVMHIKNWKHVAVDKEGGTYGIETTFAPVLYSKLSKKNQCFRYLNFLAEEGRTIPHSAGASVGTHVNVSAYSMLSHDRCSSVARTLRHEIGYELQHKFFGRVPYGYGVVRGTASGHNYIEWKLFNSTTDSKKLREYINVAVSLTKLVESDAAITTASVIEACERGLLGRVK